MKWIKLYEEFESLSQEMIDLTNKLKKYDIPVELWGTGKSKTIKHLLDELNGDECYLEESENKITDLLISSVEFDCKTLVGI